MRYQNYSPHPSHIENAKAAIKTNIDNNQYTDSFVALQDTIWNLNFAMTELIAYIENNKLLQVAERMDP